MTKNRILILDDEEIIQEMLLRAFGGNGFYIEAVGDPRAVLKRIKEDDSFNLLITDLKMPKIGGLEVLKEIKKINPYIEVIIITGYPTIEIAVAALKIGAFDFICKPFDLEQLKKTVNRCLEKQRTTLNYVKFSELNTLFEISKTISADMNIESLLIRTLDLALGIVRAKKGSILLLDENTLELTVKAARGLSEEVISNIRIPLGEGIAGKVVKGGKPLLVSDVEGAFGFGNNPRYETNSCLSIPLVSKYLSPQENVLGVINLTDKISQENFTEREQVLISVLAVQLATAIENANIYTQLQSKISILRQTVDQLVQTQKQLIQGEKMAAVGQLASSVAHEINNPLTGVLNNIQLVKMDLEQKKEYKIEELLDILNMVEESAVRCSKITRSLLEFSRASTGNLQQLSLNELVEKVCYLIEHEFNLENIKIKLNLQANLTDIMGDSQLLQQVIFNLISNAKWAIEKKNGRAGGCISIATYFNSRENTVIIEISDNGIGISMQDQEKIFEAFFTTKPAGEGTGLGLSISSGIIKEHKGTITVASQLGQGTTFKIALPGIVLKQV
jgi:signal transduction histidine kinase